MSEPEYLICIQCETPCYTFEWNDSELSEAMCMACGNDEIDDFTTDEEFEAMMSGG